VDRQREEPVVTDRDRSVVAWIGVVGAVSARDVMARFGVGRTVGDRRLRGLVDHGLLTRTRPVYGQPALYVATRDGLEWAGLPQVDPVRVNASTARHWTVCARLAVILERAEGCEVWGEPRLRAAELEADRSVASAQLGTLPDGRPRLHRPDLVLFPRPGVPCHRRGRAVGQGRAAPRGDLAGVGALPAGSRRSATTRRRMSRVRFRSRAATTAFGSCRSMTPSRRPSMSDSPA
jgi:hypothetical protein